MNESIVVGEKSGESTSDYHKNDKKDKVKDTIEGSHVGIWCSRNDALFGVRYDFFVSCCYITT